MLDHALNRGEEFRIAPNCFVIFLALRPVIVNSSDVLVLGIFEQVAANDSHFFEEHGYRGKIETQLVPRPVERPDVSAFEQPGPAA